PVVVAPNFNSIKLIGPCAPVGLLASPSGLLPKSLRGTVNVFHSPSTTGNFLFIISALAAPCSLSQKFNCAAPGMAYTDTTISVKPSVLITPPCTGEGTKPKSPQPL